MAALNTSRGYVAATVMWCSGSIPATPLAALLEIQIEPAIRVEAKQADAP